MLTIKSKEDRPGSGLQLRVKSTEDHVKVKFSAPPPRRPGMRRLP